MLIQLHNVIKHIYFELWLFFIFKIQKKYLKYFTLDTTVKLVVINKTTTIYRYLCNLLNFMALNLNRTSFLNKFLILIYNLQIAVLINRTFFFRKTFRFFNFNSILNKRKIFFIKVKNV